MSGIDDLSRRATGLSALMRLFLPFTIGMEWPLRRSRFGTSSDEEAVRVGGAGALGVGVLRQLEHALEGARRALDAEEDAARAVGRAPTPAERQDAALRRRP